MILRCLMPDLSKTWRPLDGSEAHINENSLSYNRLLIIISKFQRTTLPSFNHIELQMIKFMISFGLPEYTDFAFVLCRVWVPLIMLLDYPLDSDFLN